MRFREGELKTRRSATSCQNAYYDSPSWCKMLVSTTHQSLDLHTIAARRNNGRCGLEKLWEARLTDWLVRHSRPANWHRRYCIRRRQNRLDSAVFINSLRSHRAFRPRRKAFLFSLSVSVYTLQYDALLCCDFLWEQTLWERNFHWH